MKLWTREPAWTAPTGEYVQEDLYKRMREAWPDRPLPDLELSPTQIYNLDGVSSHDAPLPPVKHKCYVHTYGILNWFTVVHRCACGAICYDHGGAESAHHWMEKNERR